LILKSREIEGASSDLAGAHKWIARLSGEFST